ncbi:ABC transporter ATP-binding protein [Cricetibacter osteomyelitidis]|nr:ATP-binding cassette domain-containing protein [Cricetibacter osteomyelitidis]
MNLEINQLQIKVPNLPAPILSIPQLMIPTCQQLAILGPSGSGKTTLLNAISGLIDVQANQLFWDNIDLARLSANKRDQWRFNHIGIVMQDFHLTQGLTALENVLLPYAFRHRHIPDKIKQRAVGLLEKMNFHQISGKVECLSRGEMQRVSIARALLSKPDILIADEPTASLDAENSEIITALLQEMATQAGCTLIVSTHDKNLAYKMQRRIYLENGEIRHEN